MNSKLTSVPGQPAQGSSNGSRVQSRKERRQKGASRHKLDGSVAGDIEAMPMESMFVNESELFTFMHQVNEIYLDLLKQPPPFARYILLGLQSTGKSTQVERLLKFPMNIVAEGTGTRCPLYVTCINDKSLADPQCELTGCQRCAQDGSRITMKNVFNRVTCHNKDHVDGFSNEPLRLIVKSKDVQNMFFVDLPGIITTKGQGKDNRTSIKDILKKEIKVPNTKLLVLLEPKEFSTNSIVDFIDETLGKRETWLPKTLFLMTKFDLRTHDSLTGGKTNRFFAEYWTNSIKPFMIITPTLQKSADTMSPEEQYKERQALLDSASTYEKAKFDEWQEAMTKAYLQDPQSEELTETLVPYMGFTAAVAEMNRLLLEDTRGRLPQVLQDLSSKKEAAAAELASLEETMHFLDENEIRLRMAQVLQLIVDRITNYLDGSLRVADKLPFMHQTLMQEIDGEEDSDWVKQPLNHLTDAEDAWREHMADMADRGAWPKSVQVDGMFLGGKQYQRALAFFKAVMIDRLPHPDYLRPYVSTALGTLRSGLSHEDWEHATVEIIKTCVRNVSESGVNFFVKHALYIFRRLIHVAMEDLKLGETHSNMFKNLPPTLAEWMLQKYDEMLWQIGVGAVTKCHVSMEPFYSTVNPSLPTMASRQFDAPQLKAGWSNFSHHLSENNVEGLYHFTDKRNWQTIQELGGLYSWVWLEEHGQRIPAPGGDDLSRKLDTKRGVADYVHLSFCKYHPMLAATQHDGRTGDCVLLMVDPVVATWKDTIFSDKNAIASDSKIGPELTDLKEVQFAEVHKSPEEAAALQEPQKSFHQAEVMVKTHVPLQYLTKIGDVPREKGMFEKLFETTQSMAAATKASMQAEAENLALRKLEFLPAARSRMICADEVDLILKKSYEYIVGLFQFILTNLEFQFNHYIFLEFKDQLSKKMGIELVASTDWKTLVKPDESIVRRMTDLKKQVKALSVALTTVRNIQAAAPR